MKKSINYKYENSKISRKNNKIANEDLYNNPERYVKTNKSKNTDLEKYLNNFPEFSLDGITAIITNIGIIAFINSENLNSEDDIVAVYDLYDKEKDTIAVDLTSTITNYTIYNNPLGVRKIYFTKINETNKVYFEKLYTVGDDESGKQYIILDVDHILDDEDNKFPSNDGVFEIPKTIDNITTLYYDYKQSRQISAYNVSLRIKKEDIEYNESDPQTYVEIIDSINPNTNPTILDFPYNGQLYNKIDIARIAISNSAQPAYIEVR